MRILFICAALILLSPAALDAQDPPCPERTFPLSIIGRDGNIPLDLSTKDIEIESRHKLLQVDHLRLGTGPKHVAILLDTSGSMHGGYDHAQAKMLLATTALMDALKNLPENVSIALFTFNAGVQSEFDFSAQRQQIVAAAADIRKRADSLPRGRTALWDAIASALGSVPHAAPGDAIYAITDGDDNSSRVSRETVEHQLQVAGVRLYLFLLPEVFNGGLVYAPSQEARGLAESTGGAVLRVPSNVLATLSIGHTTDFALTAEQQRAVAAASSSMYRLMSSPYLVDVNVPATLKKPQGWKLILTDAKVRQNVYVYFPRQLVPCRIN